MILLNIEYIPFYKNIGKVKSIKFHSHVFLDQVLFKLINSVLVIRNGISLSKDSLKAG